MHRAPWWRRVLAALLTMVLVFSCVLLYLLEQERLALAHTAIAAAAQSGLMSTRVGPQLHVAGLVTGGVLEAHEALRAQDSGNADLTIPVSGRYGSGTLAVWMQAGFAGWHVCSMSFKDRSGLIVIVPDTSSTCERE